MSRILAILCALAPFVSAAKTVILQNPWTGADLPRYPPSIIMPDAGGFNTLTQAAFSDKSYWSYTFASNTPGRFYFVNTNSTDYQYGTTGFRPTGSAPATFDVDALFAGRDTVWIVPDTTNPRPRIPAITATDPMGKRMVVMFRSPWSGTPRFRAHGGDWGNFAQVSSANLWYSASLAGLADLKLAISDYNGMYFLGAAGQSTSSTTTLDLDAALANNDTVWIIGAATGAPKVGSYVSSQSVVLLKNPWEVTNSGTPPAVGFDQTGSWNSMTAAAGWPGWYAATIPNVYGNMTFRNGVAGTSYLSSIGIASSGYPFTMDTALLKNDTVWVVPSASGTHSVLSAPPAARAVTLMLRNPWDSLNPRQPPFARIEGADWAPLAAAPGGWFALSTALSGSRLQVGIRNATGTSYLSSIGLTSVSSNYMVLDTAFARNDTIWIVPQPNYYHLALSSEPQPRQGVVMLLNPWESNYPGLAPRVEIESQGQATMSPVAAMPGWYSAPIQFYGSLLTTFWDNAKSYSKGRYVLDTAYAKNDTIWVTFPSSSSVPRVSSVQPPEKTMTILFKSPWDSIAPFLPGSVQVEGRAWVPLAPVAGSAGWYAATVNFFTTLQVDIRDSKGTSFLSAWGTASTTSALLLDTAYAKNDTVWIVGGAGNNTPISVSTAAPATRPLTLLLQGPWESVDPGVAPSILANGRNWQSFQAHPTLPGWYASSLDLYGPAIVQIRNAARTSYMYYGGTATSNWYTLSLDTAYAKNDTLWIHRNASGTLSVVPTAPSLKPVTILFKSPWDTAIPGQPGQFNVEGHGWRVLVPLAGSAGWYVGTDTFIGSLQLAIRDSKGTSYIGYNGTTSSASSTVQLDTAYAKNDTVWIVAGAGVGTQPGIFTREPPARPLTVILQNPWEAATPGAAPSLLVNGKNWQSFLAYAPRPGWYSASLDFYGSLAVQIRNTAATSYLSANGTTSYNSSPMTLDTSYAKNDTIWIVAGPVTVPRIFSVDPDPKPIVLMLKNPWQATYPGQVPYMQIEGGAWSQAVPVAGDTGWYSTSSNFISALQVAIRLGTGTSYLGADGTSSQFFAMVLDSLARKNDTIWITDGTGGKPPRFRTMNPKTSKVVMVLNPWDGVLPLQRPVAFLGGGSNGQVLSPSMENCGWYFLETEAYPKDVLFRSSRTGEGFGAAGIGSSIALDLTGNITDTVWVAPGGSLTRISYLPISDKGTCAIALVPATVRDFKYAALGAPNSGLATNLVTDRLGADRKPVIRRGSSVPPLQAAWFRDSSGVNAATCRDLAMTLDTLTGTYRMANSTFYPIDDFVTLAGGGANPFNDKSMNAYTNNFGFCLESHGQFRYRRGQKDTIAGQDDLFHYLNGSLVANLGGTHGTLTKAVGLDTLGLVDGNVYPWDLFFCDRMSSTSVLNWSMPGLLPNPMARVDSSVTGNVSTLKVSSLRTSGQGCDRVETLAPTRGDVRLKALYDTTWITLQAGVHHGGIRVSDSSGVQVDTSALVGLPYGIYVVRLRATSDTLVFRDLVFQIEAPPYMHPYTPNARCDLKSGTMRSNAGCIHLSDLDGDTLRISRNSTRLSTEGLVLCGSASTVVPGTDIAYLQDNSGSMDDNDPTRQRGLIVEEAINLHSQLAPSSNAAYLPFESDFTSTRLYNITDPVERADLISSITLGNSGFTSYSGALGWARALLEGATSGAKTMAPSPNQNKAIILISDGRPDDETSSYRVLLPRATTNYQGSVWTLPADSSVPVFGFMITTDADAMTSGQVLYNIAQRSGGEFIVIPPNDPDSLRSAMMTVLGNIVARARPDTLRITNQANGQVSRGLSSGREGGGWRFRLDSLMGLEPGVNDLQLRGVLSTDRGDSVVNARWTVVVGDSLDEFVVGGRDTTLTLACSAPTQLKIRPPSDTTRHFADARDVSLSFWLDARYDKLLQNTVQFWTDFSSDTGRKTLGATSTPNGIRAYSNISVPWSGSVVSRKDSSVQTDFGWDTLRAVYRTPRDRRDTAVGFLPVFRDWPVSVSLSPDTLKGAQGELVVTVRDPNILLDTVRVKVYQNRRDSVWLLLRRDSVAKFTAKLPFVQGASVVLGDSILQAGSYRVVALDSVFALYQTRRDTAILRRPDPRLRFMDAAGKAMDSLPPRVMAIGARDTIRVGLFVDTLLLSNSTDSVFATVPSWLAVRTLAGGASTGRMRLVAGKVAFTVATSGPGFDGDVRITRPAGPDTLHRRIDVGGLRLRFSDGAGQVQDTARIDMDFRSDTLLRVEVWDGAALCGTCDGWMTDSVSNVHLRFLDSLGKRVDSIAIRSGRAVFRMGADAPVSKATVVLKSAGLWARGVATPVDFRPYRLRFLDGSGGVVDSARVDRDILTDTLVRVEVWGRSGLCLACTGKLGLTASMPGVRLSDSDGVTTDSISIEAGRTALRIGSERPLSGAKVVLSGALLGSASTVDPVTFRPYRLRFVHPDGAVSDSFAADTLARRAVRVAVQVWGATGSVRWNGVLRIDSIGPSLLVSDTTGKTDSLFRLVDGRTDFLIRSDVPATMRMKVSVDSIGLETGVGPITWRILAPDSAILMDNDGDGGLDAVLVKFAFPWNPDNGIALSWPDSGNVLDLSKASRKVSTDSLAVEWLFDRAQSPRTTAWRHGRVPARFSWNSAAPSVPFPALERIAPIPVRARIVRGTSKDTLVVWASEPLDANLLSGGADLVWRSFPGSSRVESQDPSWDSRRQALLLPIDRARIDSLVRSADSVRFAPRGAVRDALGATVSDTAPSVEVEGLDPAPLRAIVSDGDGDGRADQVVLHFQHAPRVVDSYRFSWPTRDGKLLDRQVKASEGEADSTGKVLVFRIDPWDFGATQCESVGCSDLGRMRTSRWGDTLAGAFALEDGVLPVILKAQLRFRRDARSPDTLRAEMSETIKAGDGSGWLRFGRASLDSLGLQIERIGQVAKDARILELLLDSTFAGQEGDSVRLAAWPEGGVEDGAKNRPGRFVHWTPLELGAPRAKLVAMVWPDLARYTGWMVPPSEKPLSVFLRSNQAAPWRTLDGRSPGQATSHYAGIVLKTNKSLESARLFLYDNMGVAIAFVDLADVQRAVREGRVESSLRGDVDVWIAWNGMSRQGSMTPSGVYLARVVGWVFIDGRREVVNQVYNLGWHNPYPVEPPADLEFLPQDDWMDW
ncbi:MAG: fibro-slime domain-containing protein [Fibrobacteres bacterium]|nr:fibro-slime domain-containing protein [Fibrobacterota bacterium]